MKKFLANMSKKTVEVLWRISLAVVCVILLALFAASFLGIELPMLAVRILGAIDLLAIPVLAWTTYRKFRLYNRIRRK